MTTSSKVEVFVDDDKFTGTGPGSMAAYADALGVEPSEVVALWSDVLHRSLTFGYTTASIQLPSGADAKWVWKLTPCRWAPEGVVVAAGVMLFVRNSSSQREPLAQFLAEDYVPREGSSALEPPDPALLDSRRWRLDQLDSTIDPS